MSSDSQQSRPPPNQTTNNRGKLSLANLAFEIPTNPHPTDTESILPTTHIQKIQTWIVWSIFNLLFLPFGLLCCYLSHQVRRFKKQNRYEMAMKWSKRTFVSNIITTLLMVGVAITIAMLRYDYDQRNPDLEYNQTRTTGAYIPWQPGR
ncbi:hypothetical protein I4U23_028640 [Adineta vaga]|nr:hypothetical protein I4U23_028640 [Adineta vaga]